MARPSPSPSEQIQARPESETLRRTWDPIWERKRRAGGWMDTVRRWGGRDAVHRLVHAVVRRELGTPAGKRLLEAGSGSGLVSLELARAGARVGLLDISRSALAMGRTVFREEKRDPDLAVARVEALPFAEGKFDGAWSAGVLEHIPVEDRARALADMFRVTRAGGTVLVLHPWAGASVYRRAKAHADQRGRWQAGAEEPIETMRPLFDAIPDAVETREYAVGYLVQYHYLKYFLDFARPLYLAWVLFVELLHLPLGWLNRYPGYLLVTVARKRGG